MFHLYRNPYALAHLVYDDMEDPHDLGEVFDLTWLAIKAFVRDQYGDKSDETARLESRWHDSVE